MKASLIEVGAVLKLKADNPYGFQADELLAAWIVSTTNPVIRLRGSLIRRGALFVRLTSRPFHYS